MHTITPVGVVIHLIPTLIVGWFVAALIVCIVKAVFHFPRFEDN